MDTYYHLHLFQPAMNLDPLEAAFRSFASELEQADGPADAAEELSEWQRELSVALRRAHPDLIPLGGDDSAAARVAESAGVSFDDARAMLERIAQVEFRDDDDVYVSLSPEVASLGVPLGFVGEDAQLVWTAVWEYLQTLAAHRPIAIFDPQQGELVHLSGDRARTVQAYEAHSEDFLGPGE